MLTHMHPAPVPRQRAARGRARRGDRVRPPGRRAAGVVRARPAEAGMLLFADTGWDQEEKWSPSLLEQLKDFYCFLPNSDEAMAYTRTDDPNDAVHALADRVPGRRGHLRRAGRPGHRLHHRGAGVGALAAGQRARPDRRGRRVRGRLRARHAARLAAAAAARVRQPVRRAVGPVRRRLAGRPRLGRHHRLARPHPGQGQRRLRATPPSWPRPTASSPTSSRPPAASRSAGPGPPSPAPPTPKPTAPRAADTPPHLALLAPRGTPWPNLGRRQPRRLP